jgi:hypothetical protein
MSMIFFLIAKYENLLLLVTSIHFLHILESEAEVILPLWYQNKGPPSILSVTHYNAVHELRTVWFSHPELPGVASLRQTTYYYPRIHGWDIVSRTNTL